MLLASAEHPRLRGEHFSAELPAVYPCGTSPPARGTRSDEIEAIYCTRNIPACAGNTRQAKHGRPMLAEHPRLRGEHFISPDNSAATAGTSPPARGTHRHCAVCLLVNRNIPACAGNTFVGFDYSLPYTEHPRLRGEHWYSADHVRGSLGTSPPARGTQVPPWPQILIHRNIPACAGNTVANWANDCILPEHPRLRGEHETIIKGANGSTGTSPPARGTPNPFVSASLAARNIPACAGNTPIITH